MTAYSDQDNYLFDLSIEQRYERAQTLIERSKEGRQRFLDTLNEEQRAQWRELSETDSEISFQWWMATFDRLTEILCTQFPSLAEHIRREAARLHEDEAFTDKVLVPSEENVRLAAMTRQQFSQEETFWLTGLRKRLQAGELGDDTAPDTEQPADEEAAP
jgi:hypothetical protein